MTDTGALDVAAKVPNLGIPQLLHLASARGRLSFEATFAVPQSTADLRRSLAGRLFLQVPADTKAVQGTLGTPPVPVMSVQQMGDHRARLVPLRVDRTGPVRPSQWWWYDEEYGYECSATLSAAAADLAEHELPQLFNLLVDHPSVPYYRVNHHAVYVRDRAWTSFDFIHATDLHVAARNDEIPAVVAALTGAAPPEYVNFNDSLRRLIRCCNALHRQGKLDLLVLTGDLVDYVTDNDSIRHPHAFNNFEYLHDILIGEPTRTAARLTGKQDLATVTPAVEALEVPVLTLLGNHDYRKNEYPLVQIPDVEVPFELELLGAVFFGIPFGVAKPAANAIVRSLLDDGIINQYESFGLSFTEAAAYTGGVPVISTEVGRRFVEYEHLPPDPYGALFNPLRDYVVRLGGSVLVALDTAHDEGVPADLYDAIIGYAGLDESTSNFLHGSPDSVGFTSAQVALVESAAATATGSVIVLCHAPVVNPEDVPGDDAREWRRVALGTTPWFAQGSRDPDLGFGVADHEFTSMAAVLTDPRHRVDLVLTGHTHRDLELRIDRVGETVRYHHDWYLQGRSDGTLAGSVDSLSGAADKAGWWKSYAPVLVQTGSLFPSSAAQDPTVLHLSVDDDVITGARTLEITDAGIRWTAHSPYWMLSVARP